MLRCDDAYLLRTVLSRLPLRRYDVERGLVTVDYDPRVLPGTEIIAAIERLGLCIARRRIVQRCLDRAARDAGRSRMDLKGRDSDLTIQ